MKKKKKKGGDHFSLGFSLKMVFSGGFKCDDREEEERRHDSSDDEDRGPRFRCRKCALPIGPQHGCKAVGGPAHRIY